MTDIEGNANANANAPPRRPPNVENPYGSAGMLPARHPLNILKRILYMAIALYGMFHFQVYHTILHSPKIRHEWFKIGLATSIASMFIKGYAEIYLGKLQKKKVSYETIPQLTHAIMVLILLASISFHVALWPAYHSKAMLIMLLLGCFLFNFCLLMPTTVQNIAGIALLTFFLQEYK